MFCFCVLKQNNTCVYKYIHSDLDLCISLRRSLYQDWQVFVEANSCVAFDNIGPTSSLVTRI